MPDVSPDDPAWLAARIDRSTLLPERTLREHWLRLIPWLSSADRYELAATLLDAERLVKAGDVSEP